ncbi:MAG: pseudaminic acid biosynthesis-associated protein PseG [Idiomarinaceae bacterium HL-53]|nr:MAG: pseudaminic acid biosynthesis-associated protein PseG [Idiomarinaceae bacterium HL-53]CUS49445.1 UDP-2,4-diacetamido-2,4,6-trideoxy-beta-L-altropyranose hydrolase [Idiomarinaceae bacterium HL-53]
MKVLIRADASLHMGTGHIMRCATLAKELRAQGADVSFCCIEQAGDLTSWLEAENFEVLRINAKPKESDSSEWLPWTEQQDAKLLIEKLSPNLRFDWIVVDHYGLSSVWHQALRAYTKRIFVIDDLANREYDADLLLDQNLGRKVENYSPHTKARVLAGTQYALLRKEFLQARNQCQTRAHIRHLLIALGGVDEHNYSSQILQILADNKVTELQQIVVVLGRTAPHLAAVKEHANRFSRGCVTVVQGVSNIAELMVDADLAIGAAGTTSWERCCLGLPTIVLELAENQRIAAEALVNEGVAEHLHVADIDKRLMRTLQSLLERPERIKEMSTQAMKLVDGQGVKRVITALNEVLA